MKITKFKGFMSDEEKKKFKDHDKPGYLILNTNKMCNFKCNYCYQDAGKSEPNQMALDDYKRVIREAKSLGVERVIIAGAGEPLMDRNCYDAKTGNFPIVDYANGLDMHTSIYSNGSLINEKMASRLAKQDTSFMISLNSLKSEIQNKLTGVQLADETYRGLRNLMKHGFNAGNKESRLAIDTLIVRDAYDEVPDIVGWAVKHNIHPVVEGLLYKGRVLVNREDLAMSQDINENYEAESRLIKKIHEKYDFGSSNFSVGACDLDQYSVTRDLHGNYVECVGGRNDKVLGNIYEKSLSNFWNGKSSRALREGCSSGCDGICAGRKYCEDNLVKLLQTKKD